jgi:predicted  nucleic acid-binding Zn-ribbon protein
MNMLNDEKLDRLCRHCGQAFSTFLHQMAERNAKVACCPKCGKPHLHKPAKAEKPSATHRVRKAFAKM